MGYRGGGGGAAQLQVPTITPVVKKLLIANVAIWVVFVLGVQSFLQGQPVYEWFGLIPNKVITQFTVWQVFTYMFLHSTSVFHILFNMLILWMFGSELEGRWGSKFFISYDLVCGVGAAVIYTVVVVAYYLITNDFLPLMAPVVGASGAVFGLLLAYGIIFGERIIYFMMIFPMKAKYFTMILGGVEFLTLFNTGFSGNVANLAHLGGLIAGFLFLTFWTRYKTGKKGKSSKSRRRNLRLVVDNERNVDGDGDSGPKYWN